MNPFSTPPEKRMETNGLSTKYVTVESPGKAVINHWISFEGTYVKCKGRQSIPTKGKHLNVIVK